MMLAAGSDGEIMMIDWFICYRSVFSFDRLLLSRTDSNLIKNKTSVIETEKFNNC